MRYEISADEAMQGPRVWLTIAGVTAPVSAVVLRHSGRAGLSDRRDREGAVELIVNGKRVTGDFDLQIAHALDLADIYYLSPVVN